jgi:Zinc finger, C3HC4 type (RING finger)
VLTSILVVCSCIIIEDGAYYCNALNLKLLEFNILKANDLNTTPSPNQVSQTPPPAQHRAVSRSTFWANSAPEQPVVNRTMPVLTSLTNSVSSPAVHRTAPISTRITSTRTTESYTTDLEDIELTRAIKASIETAIAEGVTIEPHLVPEIGTTGTTISLNDPLSSDNTSEETFYDAYVDYPPDANQKQATVTSTILNDTVTKTSRFKIEKTEVSQNGLCIVCLDSPVEAACIPCGHMAGCLACFKKIEAKSKKCPVCRAKVDQVVKIYTI